MDVTETITKGLPGAKLARRNAGLTQVDLATKVGLSRETVANYEIGAQDPRLAIVRKLATALNCTPADLLTEPQPSLTVDEELAQAEVELRALEVKIARLKAEVGNG